jgi:hypothetical protein
MGVQVAGQIYIGPALNGETIWENPAHLEPYFFYLPSYAVIANYHKRTPQHREDVRALWKEAGDFAMNEYLTALFAWPNVTPQQKASVLDKLFRYTCHSPIFIGGKMEPNSIAKTYRLRIGLCLCPDHRRVRGFQLGNLPAYLHNLAL